MYGKIAFYVINIVSVISPFSGVKDTTSFQYKNTPFFNNYYNVFVTFIWYTCHFPIEITDTDNNLPFDVPNITNLTVSHYDCPTQHNLRKFNFLNVKQCTNIEHSHVQARVDVRAETKRVKAFQCDAYASNEQKLCFQGSFKCKRVNRSVWNHNTMPLL